MLRVRRRYHLGPHGFMYVGVTILLSVGAINSQNNLLFIALGLALGGLLVSGFISGASLLNLEVHRIAPVRGGVGEPLRIRYVVRNTGRLVPAFGLTLRESVENPEILGAEPVAFALKVGRGERVEVESVAEPAGRGMLRLKRMSVYSPFPFGVLRKSVEFERAETLPIWPERLDVGRGALRRAAAEGDYSDTQRAEVGRGSEYLGVRDYLPGDSARDIAWRPSARTGQLVVREHTRPSPHRVWVGLDLHPDPDEGEARDNERAISLAAGAIDAGIEAGVDVGLLVWPGGPRTPPAAGGARTRRALLDQLAALEFPRQRPAPSAPPPTRGAALLLIHAGRTPRGQWPSTTTRIAADAPSHPDAPPTPAPLLEGVA